MNKLKLTATILCVITAIFAFSIIVMGVIFKDVWQVLAGVASVFICNYMLWKYMKIIQPRA
jgi:hypothetical protein